MFMMVKTICLVQAQGKMCEKGKWEELVFVSFPIFDSGELIKSATWFCFLLAHPVGPTVATNCFFMGTWYINFKITVIVAIQQLTSDARITGISEISENQKHTKVCQECFPVEV